MHQKWNSSDVETAVSRAVQGHLSIRGSKELYDRPFCTVHWKAKGMKEVAAVLYLLVSDRIGYPVGLSPEMKLAVLERILYLEQRGLWLTPV